MTETPVFFSRDEIQRIRNAMRSGDDMVTCPLCARPLVLCGPIASEGGEMRMFGVDCRPCRRTAVITEAVGQREPKGRY